MSWSISELKNTVKVSVELAEKLYNAQKSNRAFIWEDEDEVLSGEYLYFNTDHQEHMDYLNNKFVIDLLTENKVEGVICFGSLEGDNEGEFWGYKFDGQGNVKKLKGKINWEEDVAE